MHTSPITVKGTEWNISLENTAPHPILTQPISAETETETEKETESEPK